MSDILNGQHLVLPINKCVFSAGYKNKTYLQQQGYNHYGVDLFSDNDGLNVYACGEGEVVACGWDGVPGNDRLGNVIAIIYKNVIVPNDIYDSNKRIIFKKGDVIDITSRMFHLSNILCKVGQKVDKNTVIGYYGNTGSTLVNGKPMGYHLHIEFDTDTKWPTLCPGVSIGGNIFNKNEDYIKAGAIIDSTINPSKIWNLDSNQYIYGKYVGWFNNEDINLPRINNIQDNDKERYDGIDVSVFQGDIDWEKVKSSGIDFVFIRLGWTWYDGGLDIDKNFYKNIEGAINSGLNIGVYVYAYDKTPEASKISANKVMEIIKNYKLSYPVVYDFEELELSGYLNNSKEYNNSIISSFLDTLEKNKYYAMLYTFTSFAISYLDMSKLSRYDLWIADYRSKDILDKDFKYPYGIWQYIGTGGKCEGVLTDCDRNYSYKNYPSIIKGAGLNNFDEQEDNEDNNEYNKQKIEELLLEIDSLNKEISNLKEENSIINEENSIYKHKIENLKIELNSILSNL